MVQQCGTANRKTVTQWEKQLAGFVELFFSCCNSCTKSDIYEEKGKTFQAAINTWNSIWQWFGCLRSAYMSDQRNGYHAIQVRLKLRLWENRIRWAKKDKSVLTVSSSSVPSHLHLFVFNIDIMSRCRVVFMFMWNTSENLFGKIDIFVKTIPILYLNCCKSSL